MAKIPPTLRGLFSAGGAASLALREFRGAAELCHDLLEGAEHGDLLAAGTLYSGLFESTAAGDSLGRVLGRLVEPLDQAARPPGDRGRRMPEFPTEGARRVSAGESEGRGEAGGVKRAAAVAPQEPAGAVRPEPLARQASAGVTRPEPLAPQASAGAVRREPIALPESVGLERPEVGVGTRESSRASLSPGHVAGQRWSCETAARELSDRFERAGLMEVWSRPAREWSVALALVAPAPAPAAEGGITQAVAARLAPAVETITRRYATRKGVTPQPLQRSGGLVQTAEADESASVMDREVETPLRRLAALGRLTEDVRVRMDAGQSPANGRDTRAVAALWMPRRSERVVGLRGTGQEASPTRASAGPGDDREFAERLAAVLHQEALRNGIDPLEYES
jgi:hypothetical protein